MALDECNNKCPWRQEVVRGGTLRWKCELHGGQFPCRDKACGHSDCAGVRGAVCYKCRRPIDDASVRVRRTVLNRPRFFHAEVCE